MSGPSEARVISDPTALGNPERKGTISIVVPMFNEEAGLGPLAERLVPVLERVGAMDWEVVLVDDGSGDATLEAARVLNAREPRFKVVALSRNFGKEIAVTAGLRYARGDAVVIMDADLQHPPELITEFVARWREGYRMVYAKRRDRDTEGPVRRFAAHSFYILFRAVSGIALPEGAGDFRLLDRRAVDAMNRLGERARFNKGLFAWIGFRSIGVPYDVTARSAGVSRWRPRALLRFAIDGITSFSTIPLRVWSYVGALVSLFALAYSVVMLLKTMLFGSNLPGFPSLIVSVLFLGGIQLLSLGIIGEYLGRMFEEVKGRPLFIVADELGFEGLGTQGRRTGDANAPLTLEQGGES